MGSAAPHHSPVFYFQSQGSFALSHALEIERRHVTQASCDIERMSNGVAPNGEYFIAGAGLPNLHFPGQKHELLWMLP